MKQTEPEVVHSYPLKCTSSINTVDSRLSNFPVNSAAGEWAYGNKLFPFKLQMTSWSEDIKSSPWHCDAYKEAFLHSRNFNINGVLIVGSIKTKPAPKTRAPI